ncbi:hypothetical protein [Streptomyces luteogriseus]|nr:hypothetical protein [Streptomyces luteogriseus]WTJ32779.1 hypothetical protein OID52_39935 [Streptomyces luteogriseus]
MRIPGTCTLLPAPAPAASVTGGPPVAALLGFRSDAAGAPR